jgi:hypothetical protein
LADKDIPQQLWYLCRLALLAHSTFLDLLVLPASIAFRVSPKDITASFDESPTVVKELMRQIASTVLILLRVHSDRSPNERPVPELG